MTLVGSIGNDKLNATTTNNTNVDGLAGLDVLTYDGSFTDFTINVDSGLLTLTEKTNGTDQLTGIEKIRFLGDDKQVSLSTETIVNTQTLGAQTGTTVIALPNGGFIDFWQGTDGYYFRKFDASGTALGLEKKILADATGVKPAIQSDGSIVLAWPTADADKNGISVQLFNADGTVKSPIFRANDTITDEQSLPSVAVLSDDSFVVAWTSANQGDSLQYDGIQMGDTPNQAGVFAQHFDQLGNPLAWEVKISDSGGSDAFVTALDDGNYIVGYEAIRVGSGQMTIFAKFFDVNDQLLNVKVVNTTVENTDIFVPDPDFNELAGKEKLPTATKLADGSVVMVWQAPRDAYPTKDGHDVHDGSIIARLFSSTGVELTDEIVVNTFTTYEQSQPAVASLTDGGFVVVWQSMLQDESYWGVYGQRFDQFGAKVGDEFQVHTKTHDSQQQPSVTGLADGGFVVSWEAEYQDGNQQGIFQNGSAETEIIMQRYDAAGNAMGNSFAGGSGNDTITIGGTSNIEIDGAAGDDILTSGDGNDTLRGNAGNDILDGGLGNNTIIGGEGIDILKLSGLAKDYSITGTNGNYLIKGLTQNLENSLIGIEKLQFGDGSLMSLSTDNNQGGGGSGTVGITEEDLNLIGGKSGTILTGTSGDDTLKGGNTKGAPDTLQGGEGNDLYVALGNRLVIYDTAGNDTLQVATSINLANPSKNKIKGLESIENVELQGQAALKLTGNDAANTLIGNSGKNIIKGEAGDDIIYGGLGRDKLIGGEGRDTFVFNTDPSRKNVDKITDFSGDKILLDSTIFSGLDPENDGKVAFLSGNGLKKAYADTASFLVYDTKSGKLYYDAEDDLSPTLIATVGTPSVNLNGNIISIAATLTADDFGLLV